MNNTITLEEAIKMTTLYRAQKDLILKPDLLGKNILVFSETFDREVIDAVLAQDGCIGIRVYKGMKEDLQIKSIIVGVNKDGDDILPSEEPALTTTTTVPIAEDAITCPPVCPRASVLNPG